MPEKRTMVLTGLASWTLDSAVLFPIVINTYWSCITIFYPGLPKDVSLAQRKLLTYLFLILTQDY